MNRDSSAVFGLSGLSETDPSHGASQPVNHRLASLAKPTTGRLLNKSLRRYLSSVIKVSKKRFLLSLLLIAFIAVIGAWLYFRPLPVEDTAAPYALWRDGKIVEVRNCGSVANQTHLLRCASLICEQAVSQRLVNPMEAQLQTTRTRVNEQNHEIEIIGSINYRTSISTPLPTVFSCQLTKLRIIDVKLTRETELKQRE